MNDIWITLIIMLGLIVGVATWQLFAIGKAATKHAPARDLEALRERIQALEAAVYRKQAPESTNDD